MEPQAALVGSDRAVHLDAETAINLNASLIVKPGHAEHDYPFRLDDPFQDTGRLVFWMLRQHQPQRIEHLLHRLMKLRLGGILRLHADHYLFNVVPGTFDSRRCHHRSHKSYLRTWELSNRANLITGSVSKVAFNSDADFPHMHSHEPAKAVPGRTLR